MVVRLLTTISGRQCKSSLSHFQCTTVMLGTFSSTGCNNLNSWINASASSRTQVSGVTFLSQVMASPTVVGFMHACHSTLPSQRRSGASPRYRCLLGSGSTSSESSLQSRGASQGSHRCMPPLAAPKAWQHPASYSACQQGPPVRMPAAVDGSWTPSATRHGPCCPAVRHSLSHPPACTSDVCLQQTQRCSLAVAAIGSCNHKTAVVLDVVSRHARVPQLVGESQPAVAAVHAVHGYPAHAERNGYLIPAAYTAASVSTGSDDNFGTVASSWRTKGIGELTSEEKRELLRHKLAEYWQQDPYEVGVNFNISDQQRCTCPQCYNGSKGEDAFSVLVTDDHVCWCCHRATCGFQGSVSVFGGIDVTSQQAAGAAEGLINSLSQMQGPTSPLLTSAKEVHNQLQQQVQNRPTADQLGARFKPLSEPLLEWFQARGISKATLDRNGIMMEVRYCSPLQQEVEHIAFPYYKNGSIVNVKYRALDKYFSQTKGGEQVFYGYDDAKGVDDLYIVEGEMDKLAIEEALELHSRAPSSRSAAVVSVPSGAPGFAANNTARGKERKLRYVEACSDILSSVKRIILAVDADAPGVGLAEELARRIGREKCWRVTWPTGPDDSLRDNAAEKAQELEAALAAGQQAPFDVSEWACKDANEALMKDGPEALRGYLSAATPLPINGLFRFDDFYDQVYDLYSQGPLGLSWGVSTGWDSVDTCYKVVPGELSIVTGLPNSGKSEWLDALAVNLAKEPGWRFALCSMENSPKEHARKLMEKYTEKAFFNAQYSIGTAKMSFHELLDALMWIDSRFHIISPPPDAMPSIEYILDKARAAVLRYGIKGLIIDPYNELDHRRPSSFNETEHVSRLLTKIKRFAQHYDCHVWLVAHPRAQRGLGVGGGSASLPPPTMYDISGSAHFINKADNGIVVHRPYSAQGGQGDPCTVQLLVRKVRNKLAGKIGDVMLRYDRATGQYSDVDQPQ